MACFVTKTTIPFGKPSGTPKVHTVLIDDHIWILFNNERDAAFPKKQFYKYHTDLLTLEAVDCVFPNKTHGFLTEMKSCKNYIYVFFCKQIPETSVFKFDVNTLQWQFCMRFNVYSIHFGPIIEDQLYIINGDISGPKSLMKVDLRLKLVVNTPFHSEAENCFLSLLENEGEVYILKQTRHDHLFKISKIVDGNEQELNTHCFRNYVDRTNMARYDVITVANGRVLAAWKIYDFSEANTIYLEFFDFTTNKWKRSALQDFVRDNMNCISTMIVKGNIGFAVFQKEWQKEKLSIEMVELFPTLSSICMKNQIDKTNRADDFDAIKPFLSIPLKAKLENMLEWKIPENDIKLARQQKIKAIDEILQMNEDETVDHRLKRKLHTVFDSDFSDQSGSDITDAEAEPIDDSDDEVPLHMLPFFGPIDEREIGLEL